MGEYLSTEETCEALGNITPTHLRRLVKAGIVPEPARLTPGRNAYPKHKIDQIRQARLAEAEARATAHIAAQAELDAERAARQAERDARAAEQAARAVERIAAAQRRAAAAAERAAAARRRADAAAERAAGTQAA